MIKYSEFPVTSNYPFNKNIFILFQKTHFSHQSGKDSFSLFRPLFLVSPRQGATRALVSPCFSLLAVSRTPPERTHEYFKGPLPANDSPSRSSSPSAVFSTFATTVRCTLGGKTIGNSAFTIAIPWFFKDGQRVSNDTFTSDTTIYYTMQFSELYFEVKVFFFFLKFYITE